MVKLTERQEQLLHILERQPEAMSGGELATICGVTRQVVVHDIALLRAAGYEVLSTPRGYQLPAVRPGTHQHALSVYHPPKLTEFELYTLVDHGIYIKDVQIEHPIYGELRGSLHLASRKDVELFLVQMASTDAMLLSSLTDGHHLHNIEYTDPKRLRQAIEALRTGGVEVFESP